MRSFALALALAVVASAVAAVPLPPLVCDAPADPAKIDPALSERMADRSARLPVIVEVRVEGRPPQPRSNEAAANTAMDLLGRCGNTAVGGLALINSAAGWADAAGIEFLSSRPEVVAVFADHTIKPTAAPASDFPPGQLVTPYPRAVRADAAWQSGYRGAGVTVAVLDSGIADDGDLAGRIVARVSFAGTSPRADDGGHGTHVAGIVAGSGARSSGEYVGIAPHARLADVRVLNRDGKGRVSSAVRGIEWALAHRTEHGIRVLNLSFGAPPRTSYRRDPLTSAVEIAWRRGVVTVIAAGNGGRDAVGTPGIDPYAITVGATDDMRTNSRSDDSFPAFSAWGRPSTAKPDVVAPGRRIASIHVPGSVLGTRYADRIERSRNGTPYLRLTGTSMATAVVSGAVALLLSAQPALRPDQVKAILIGTAQAYGEDSKASAPPDPIADGAGLVDAFAAATSGIRSSANQGLRPADGFCRAMYPVLYGTPLRYHDGTSVAWDSVAWDSVAWDSIAWDSVAWDSVAWDSVAWDSVAWDSVAWDSVAWDSVAWDSSPAWDSSGLD